MPRYPRIRTLIQNSQFLNSLSRVFAVEYAIFAPS